jgi:hypothetical protein
LTDGDQARTSFGFLDLKSSPGINTANGNPSIQKCFK